MSTTLVDYKLHETSLENSVGPSRYSASICWMDEWKDEKIDV
jgi:hypothetical protein